MHDTLRHSLIWVSSTVLNTIKQRGPLCYVAVSIILHIIRPYRSYIIAFFPMRNYIVDNETPCSQQSFSSACLILAYSRKTLHESIKIFLKHARLNARHVARIWLQPRPNTRALATAGWVEMTIGLPITGCSPSKNTVWRVRTRLTSPDVWAADSKRQNKQTKNKKKGGSARTLKAIKKDNLFVVFNLVGEHLISSSYWKRPRPQTTGTNCNWWQDFEGIAATI